ncbi:hypothetical protein M430DRAFT_95721 [Amorphotheca resinae ATCC 22711]|uniref:Zn(2)-C6 fungal-type domain-containing protein n=1 Tax=Amorphotheca resinae ATCC 22711 TaxID=857342 RepID=A0A2T3BA82_AMORE|nr:hypothetical protein M430DRAFT_95721 [Amorphotheca resinae ATCC 22711]PSS25189.1 hypothetical protein M430DRAFT_95721 [Amorphotheca resinae ATCC 22711]
MPPRRSHKKSKAGCKRCKTRKIKCDELHPICGNCSKHGVSCDFQDSGFAPSTPNPSSNPLRNGRYSTETPSISASSPGSNSAVVSFYRTPIDPVRASLNPAASRSLELKLMHHYTVSTANTFSDQQAQKEAWQLSVPTIAYDAQYLMDAILAVSALHLRALHPNDQTLIRASHGYMASALAQYSSLLRNGVSEYNAEALFTTAALIAFQSSASRRFDDSDGEYALPLAWFHSFQGVKTVVMASWQWLRNSDRIHPIISAQPPLRLNLHPDNKTFFSPLLEGMDEQLAAEAERTRAETKQGYEHAIAFLNWAHQKPERARIIGFAATVSRRFVTLIGQHDPRALVIIACYFAMTKVVDDVWWLHGVAKREVNGIYGLLPIEWLAKMEWPMRIANHEGPVDDDTWGINNWSTEEPEVKEEIEGGVRAHIDMLAEFMNDCAPQQPPD